MASSGNTARMLATPRLLMLDTLAVASVREAQEGGGGRRPGRSQGRQGPCRHAFTHSWSAFLLSPHHLFSQSLLTRDWRGVLEPGCSIVPASISSYMHPLWKWTLVQTWALLAREKALRVPVSQLRVQGPRPGSTCRGQASLRRYGETVGRVKSVFFLHEYVLPL